MSEKDNGQLVYTTRGFLQDAQDAMRGDVLRALIELITNADDAYNGKGGDIHIDVRVAEVPFEWIISIHDKAGGLSADGLKKAFSNLGDENQSLPRIRAHAGSSVAVLKMLPFSEKLAFTQFAKLSTQNFKFSLRNPSGSEMQLTFHQPLHIRASSN